MVSYCVQHMYYFKPPVQPSVAKVANEPLPGAKVKFMSDRTDISALLAMR